MMILLLWLILQVVTPVNWTTIDKGDSVTLSATVEEGWHMSVFEINGLDPEDDNEYTGTYSVTLAKADDPAVRFNACNDQMCTAPETYAPEINHEAINADDHQRDAINAQSLWSLFLIGLLAGLLAIFTPCVWPIIPMTVSFFLKRTDNGIRSALLYGASIIVIYVGLGLLVTILFGASALNALSTNAVVNLIFFALLVIFALSFFGLFEITLPSSWSTAMDSKARSTGGVLSILFMAFTLVIVSFSCTGPIVGTLLVEAAGHSLLAPTIGMFGFALALALPFSLFAMFPQWLQSIPRSGGWMTSFKVVLAFLELALSLKFLSVADMAYGWNILPRWLFIALWIICFAGIGIYLIWNIRKASHTRKIIQSVFIVLSWGFAAYLVPGLWGAPVRAIAAFAPPVPIEGKAVFHNYEEGMAYARQQGLPVVVDFSGYGCVNCRKMESWVIQTDTVQQRLQHYVFIELMVDDKKDGIGERNSALERELIGSNAQPYYIQLDAYGNRLSDPIAFTTDPNEFLDWLIY